MDGNGGVRGAQPWDLLGEARVPLPLGCDRFCLQLAVDDTRDEIRFAISAPADGALPVVVREWLYRLHLAPDPYSEEVRQRPVGGLARAQRYPDRLKFPR